MLAFKTQVTVPIFGTKTSGNVRTSWALTTSYQTESGTQPTKTFATGDYSKLNLDILYTMGAAETANTVELKIECSPDGANFYRIPNESVSGATSTITNREFTYLGADAAAASISVGLDIFYKFVRVSAKESGVAANAGSIFCDLTLSGW